MKYAIDRIEDNIATLENIDNNEIINIDINNLPKNIKEGTILKYENNTYTIDEKEELERRKKIQAKFARLKKAS